jgi:hypothetical protein
MNCDAWRTDLDVESETSIERSASRRETTQAARATADWRYTILKCDIGYRKSSPESSTIR